MPRMPRGRWYLNERDSTERPPAASALAMVSPANAVCRSPSKLKDRFLERSIRSPRPGSRSTIGSALRLGGAVLVDRHRLQHLVADRIAAGDEPEIGRGVQPPFVDDAGRIFLQEEIGRPL